MPAFKHTPGQPCCDVCLCEPAESIETWGLSILGLSIGGPWGETVDCERTGSDCEQLNDQEWYDHTISGDWLESKIVPTCLGCSVEIDGFWSKTRNAKRIKLWYSVGVTVSVRVEPCTGGVKFFATVSYDVLLYWGISTVQQVIRQKVPYTCPTGPWGTPPGYPDPLGSFDPPTPTRPCTLPWGTTGCPSASVLSASGCQTVEEDTDVTYRYVMSGSSCAVGNLGWKLRVRTSEACCDVNGCVGNPTRTTRVQLSREYASECVSCGELSEVDLVRTNDVQTDELYSLLPHLNWCADFPTPSTLNLVIPWKLVLANT